MWCDLGMLQCWFPVYYSILSSEREHDSVVMPLLRPPHMLGRVQITSITYLSVYTGIFGWEFKSVTWEAVNPQTFVRHLAPLVFVLHFIPAMLLYLVNCPLGHRHLCHSTNEVTAALNQAETNQSEDSIQTLFTLVHTYMEPIPMPQLCIGNRK